MANELTDSSMYEKRDRPDWPLNALPKHWMEALFSKMIAFYGDKFTMMWRGAKVEEVQKAWGIELFKLSREQLKAGSDALTAFNRPPTLPEFVTHCRVQRMEQAASTAPRIESLPKATSEEAAANLVRINQSVASVRRSRITAEWAYKLVIRAKSVSGLPVPYGVMKCATDAITSSAGRKVIAECNEPGLKEAYQRLWQETVDNYRMRGIPLWETP